MTEVSVVDNITIIKPACDIVASMAGDLKGKLKELLASGTAGLRIDLDGVEMVDSAGLGVLIAAHNSLQKQDASLELVNASDDILKLLQNMRLDQHFTII